MQDCKPDSNNNCGFFSLAPEKFTVLSLLIALILIGELSIDQQNSLGNFLLSIGQDMLTNAAQASLLQSEKNNKNIAAQLEILKAQIDLLEQQLKY